MMRATRGAKVSLMSAFDPKQSLAIFWANDCRPSVSRRSPKLARKSWSNESIHSMATTRSTARATT